MIITKEQCLDLFKEIGFDKAAMDLGISLGQMSEEDNDQSWTNVIDAAREFTDNDEPTMVDFILEVEHYETK